MAQENPGLVFWIIAGGAAAATVYMLWRFLGFVRRDRFVEDTPIVRIRSAAQGYVHVQGRVAPCSGESTVSPLSGRSCVWWDYQVARRCRNAKGQTQWSVIDRACSVAPFTLADEDGQCLVGPVGADIAPTSRDVWFGDTPKPLGPPPAFRSFLTSELEYRYTERLITPGAHVSVLGEFRSHAEGIEIEQQVRTLLDSWKNDQALLLQRFDRDHDGHIDAEEWEAARAAARAQVQASTLRSPSQRISVVAQTTHGEPFLIAPLDAQQLVRRERRHATVSLFMSALFVALTAWAIHKALAIHALASG
jgi:hypothetical protein